MMTADRDAGATEAWLRLSLARGLGPARIHALVTAFGTPQEVFAASGSELRSVPGIGPAAVEALRSAELDRRVSSTLKLAADREFGIIALGDESYPPLLLNLAAPPVILYIHGRLLPGDRISLAVVGPRKSSDYGRAMTASIVPPLCARGITIVSGLAYGIDAEAHRAALDCGGRTIGVLAHGLDLEVSPRANQKLARRIVQEDAGALISAFPFGTPADAGCFPQRNEIVAGLSLGALIVEAAEKSGALITARNSAELGRPVMACPGDATRPSARGANRLIADGAAMVQGSDDVIEAMEAELRGARAELGEDESPDAGDGVESGRGQERADAARKVIRDPLALVIREILELDHRPIDFILDECAGRSFEHGAVVQKLLELELNGDLRQLPGRVYALCQR